MRFLLIVLLAALACNPTSPPPTTVDAADQPAKPSERKPDEAPTPTPQPSSEPVSEMRERQIHDELAALLEKKRAVWEPAAGDDPGKYNQLRESAEDEATAEIAKKFGTSPAEVDRIYLKIAAGEM